MFYIFRGHFNGFYAKSNSFAVYPFIFVPKICKGGKVLLLYLPSNHKLITKILFYYIFADILDKGASSYNNKIIMPVFYSP